MKEIDRCKIITSRRLVDLNEEINELLSLNSGWDLRGELHTVENGLYTQTMVRYKDNEPINNRRGKISEENTLEEDNKIIIEKLRKENKLFKFVLLSLIINQNSKNR
jgi:hypothetical protein